MSDASSEWKRRNASTPMNSAAKGGTEGVFSMTRSRMPNWMLSEVASFSSKSVRCEHREMVPHKLHVHWLIVLPMVGYIRERERERECMSV